MRSAIAYSEHIVRFFKDLRMDFRAQVAKNNNLDKGEKIFLGEFGTIHTYEGAINRRIEYLLDKAQDPELNELRDLYVESLTELGKLL